MNTICNDFPAIRHLNYLFISIWLDRLSQSLCCSAGVWKSRLHSWCVFGFCQTSCNEKVWVSRNLTRVHFGIYISRGSREEKGERGRRQWKVLCLWMEVRFFPLSLILCLFWLTYSQSSVPAARQSLCRRVEPTQQERRQQAWRRYVQLKELSS